MKARAAGANRHETLGQVIGIKDKIRALGETKFPRTLDFPGARNGIRTRDPRLGKPMLYP